MYFDLQLATIQDLKTICRFADYWLAGRGIKDNAPGAVNDYFISPSQHKKYILKYKTYLVLVENQILVWAVIQNDGSLIHFLVNGYYRGQGIGSLILEKMAPLRIHSKSNQSSGDPAPFYEKCGFRKVRSVQSKSRLDIDKLKPDRKPIIDIFEKVSNVSEPMAQTIRS